MYKGNTSNIETVIARTLVDRFPNRVGNFYIVLGIREKRLTRRKKIKR